MRPLELKLQGFRSYRDTVVFDWRGRRLVGIVGPIGSGKSTILDAVSFALYGKTPSIGGETRSLINQSSDQCHVELRFEVEGQIWRATRALRKRGQAGHTLALLESDEADPETLETVTGERAVNDRVAQLLGMDFSAFCRSVLLAQNRFSEFLHATPTERDRVLKSVFGYDRLGAAHDVAKSRLALSEARLADLQKQTSQVQEARSLLNDARSAEAAALKRSRRLQAVAVELESAGSRRSAAVADGQRMQTRMDQLA
jgi:DNA repair protein SbcC/Rad50